MQGNRDGDHATYIKLPPNAVWGNLTLLIGYHVMGVGVRCGCSIPRTMALAIALSDLGVGDYWEDVDRYVRNHATATQWMDLDQLRDHAKMAPQHDLQSPRENADHVLERGLGSFIAFSTVTRTSAAVKAGGCCNSNSTQGLYYAWEAIVRFARGTGTVTTVSTSRYSHLS